MQDGEVFGLLDGVRTDKDKGLHVLKGYAVGLDADRLGVK